MGKKKLKKKVSAKKSQKRKAKKKNMLNVHDVLEKLEKAPKVEVVQEVIDEIGEAPEEIEEIVEKPLTAFKKKLKSSEHYVDGKKLLDEMVIYRNLVLTYKASPDGNTKPRIPEYIGASILKIAERLSSKPNFAMYTYREDMISDGIENCLTYLDNFDPAKSSNPFAYFTQIIYYAFLRRIQKEKKQTYVKLKLFEKMDTKGEFSHWAKKKTDGELDEKNPYADYFKMKPTDVKFFEEKAVTDKAKKNSKKKRTSIDEFSGE